MENRPEFGFGEVNYFAAYGVTVVEIQAQQGPRTGSLRDDPLLPCLPTGKMMLTEGQAQEPHTHAHARTHTHTHTHTYTYRVLFSFPVSVLLFPLLKIHSQIGPGVISSDNENVIPNKH